MALTSWLMGRLPVTQSEMLSLSIPASKAICLMRIPFFSIWFSNHAVVTVLAGEGAKGTGLITNFMLGKILAKSSFVRLINVASAAY